MVIICYMARSCLRVDGYQVIDLPRPRPRVDSLSTNHGGVAAVARPGVRLTSFDVGASLSTFVVLPLRVVSGSTTCAVIVMYRTGPVAAPFFTELSGVLERAVSSAELIYVVGDLNIRLDRPDDVASPQLTDLLASFRLSCLVTVPTHDRGGLLDVVASRDDLPAPIVDVIDVGLSDHRLLLFRNFVRCTRSLLTARHHNSLFDDDDDDNFEVGTTEATGIPQSLWRCLFTTKVDARNTMQDRQT